MCDTVCVIDEDRVLFAKNSDRPPTEPQVVRAFERRAAEASRRTQYIEIPDHDACAFVGSQPTWLWGVEHGVNEHGVAIGNEKVWTTGRPRTRSPALLGMDIVRLGLERSSTADAARAVMTALIERYGQGGSGELDHDEPYDSSFLIADRNGGWVLETCDRTWVAAPIDSGASISNRLSVTTNWARASDDVGPHADFQHWRNPKVPTTIADHRLATTQRAVTASISDPRAIARVLRDHGACADEERTADVAPLPDAPGDDNRGVTFYWEHLGLLSDPAYAARWEKKLARYRASKIAPRDEGGGESGTLLITRDDAKGGLDAARIAKLIDEVIGG